MYILQRRDHRNGRKVGSDEFFQCVDCRVIFSTNKTAGRDSCTTGYGIDRKNDTVCYECCGKRNTADMMKTGRATLYLTTAPDGYWLDGKTYRLTNWPGSTSFRPHYMRKGAHSIAGTRYSVWFSGPDKKVWFGVQYGENTQLCHCRRLAH